MRQHPQASWGPAGAAARQPRTAVAVKGRDRDTALLLSVSKADAGGKRRGLRVWSVGTPVAKGEVYRWLKLEWPTAEALDAGATFPPGACHFPQYGEEYFRQLTAERLVTRIVKGFPRGSWEKEPGRRNEALDCRVYARAAAAIYGLDRCEGVGPAVFLGVLADPVPEMRCAAIHALARRKTVEAAPRLAELLSDPDRTVKLRAARAVALIGAPVPSAAPGLVRFLQVLCVAPVFPIIVARVAHASGQAVGIINAARIGAAFTGPVIATTVLAWSAPAGLYLVLAALGLACVPLTGVRSRPRG